eukprot:CAMPEP_0203665848 /NCGR_PEP_ID=MMETSP0090-20130426/3006_1 /ASSEMBLY_ACC=CAM_ASM_001088 /TAXON_ID=426623 /ORGANISM="Chaetoceros affinis, Strain CCMP159" /LENGTH=165 /DNA_ID=CAMNT_0050529557 /DNA_START=26 /DNA_END=523 /DNA_ORIENTATION=+
MLETSKSLEKAHPDDDIPNMDIVKGTPEKNDDDDDDDDIPDELKCEVVDMNNPQMDPLEWSFRKLISIPKKYYWQTGNYNVSTRTKVWHRTVGALGLSLRVAERVGEVLANITGLNSNRFNYITDHMTEEEWAAARRRAEEARLKRKEKREREKVAKEKHTIQVV